MGLVKDVTKMVMDKEHHYAITDNDNIADNVSEFFHDSFAYDANYLYNALAAMKNLNGGKLDFDIMVPKEAYPLILTNGIQAYLIAPRAAHRR